MFALNILVIIVSLGILTALLTRKQFFRALMLVIAVLPLYELGRVQVGPIPTTVVELNILLLFGWWTAKQITNHKHQTTNKSQVSNSWFDKLTMTIKYVVLSLSKGEIWDLVLGISRSAGRALGSWSWVVLAWLIIATLSTIVSPNLREAAGVWKAFFVEPILLLIVFINIVKKEQIPSVFNVLIGSGVFVAMIGIIQRFTGWWIENPFWANESTRRVTSVFPFPNAVGLYLAPIAIIAITLAFSHLPEIINHKHQITNKSQITSTKLQTVWNLIFWKLKFVWNLLIGIWNFKTRWRNLQGFLMYTTSFCFIIAGITFARSRGALLGVLVGTVVLAFIHNGRRAWYWLGICVVVASILASGQWNTITKQLLDQPTSFSGGDSIHIRLEQWKETAQFISENPLRGAGIAGFQTGIAPYHHNPNVEIYKYPHNVFLNFWTELGLAGLILFLIIVFKFYTLLFKWFDDSKSQITNHKSQTNSKPQTPNHKRIEVWNLRFIWNLLFVIWNLPNHNTSDNKTDNIPRYALGAAFTTLLVHGLVDVPYFKNDLSALFWILIGISIIMEKTCITNHVSGSMRNSVGISHDT